MLHDSTDNIAVCVARLAQYDCSNLLEKYERQKLQDSEDLIDTKTEIYSAYLLSDFCSKLTSIPASGTMSPDLLAIICDVEIEFEVTNSRLKEQQKEMAEFAALITKRLDYLDSFHVYRVRFTKIFELKELEELLVKVQQDVPGSTQILGDTMRIEKFAVGETWPAEEKFLPDQLATPASMTLKTSIDFESKNITSVQKTDCRWVLSTKSYINSFSKKWDGAQASNTRPYIVICDVTTLPGAFAWFEKNLPLSRDRVSASISGVLLTKRQFGSAGFQILTKYFENLSGKRKLPLTEGLFTNPIAI